MSLMVAVMILIITLMVNVMNFIGTLFVAGRNFIIFASQGLRLKDPPTPLRQSWL